MANMQIQSSNGTQVITNLKERKIIINNVEYEIPKKVANRGSSTTIIDGTVYINGYLFIREKKEFKRTFMAFWHRWF